MLWTFSPLLASPNPTAFLYGDGLRICCALNDIKEGSCHLSAALYPCERFAEGLEPQFALWHHLSLRRRAIWKDLLMPCRDSFISFIEMINYESLWDCMSQSSSPNLWFPSSLAADILYFRNNKQSHSIVKICLYFILCTYGIDQDLHLPKMD